MTLPCFATSLLLASLTISGCAGNDDSAALIEDACSADSECPGTQVCNYGICTVAEAESQEIGFKLIPPNSSTLRPQVIAPAPVELNEPLTLGMRSSVRVAGRLLFSDTGGVSGEGPTGTLTFRRRSSYASGFVHQQRVEDDASYDVLLLPGPYDVTFTPDDPERPGRVWQELRFELDTDPQLTVPLRTEVVSARIIDRVSATMLEARGLSDARIVAISKTTGARSTVATTDESGNVRFAVYPSTGLYDIQITDESENLTREVLLDSVLDCTQGCKSTLTEGDLLDFNISEAFADRSATTLELDAAGATSADFVDTRAEIEGTFPSGRWTVRTTLGDSGKRELFLPTGDYEVRIRTAPDARFASNRAMLVADGANALRVRLEEKTSFATRVNDFDGSPLADARVELQPVEEEADAIVALSDAEGRVEAMIEPIGYWMVVTPASNAKPRGVRYLPAAGIVAFSESGYTLPEPVVVSGTALGAASDAEETWVPVSDVTIQAFKVVEGRTLTVGEATTREDGTFKMVIPAASPRSTRR